jgi:hypothetical protein
MLFRADILQGIAEGRVTLAFRRWRKAPPREGSTLRTAVGVLAFDRVRIVNERDIGDDDARRAGAPSREALLASLRGEGTVIRIELRLAGQDPRLALRTRPPSNADAAEILSTLARFDRAAAAPWTARYLQLVADQPGIAARRLAPQVSAEWLPFKRRVRRLKELGLTESLDVGYRLSPRGQHVLARLASRGG